jgi:uncharacterized membrane protein
MLRRIGKAIIVGTARTPAQDLEFSVRQLVEIALRALSPSLNDPFTAIAVIDRLAAALEVVSSRCLPTGEYRDSEGRVRLLADSVDYAGLVDAAFNQIRQSSSQNPAVLINLARRLSDLSQVAATSEQLKTLVRHLKMLERVAATVPEPDDRKALLSVIAVGLEPGRYADPRLIRATARA